MKDIIQIVKQTTMNTQINPLEITFKGTATQIFIRTSTEGISIV